MTKKLELFPKQISEQATRAWRSKRSGRTDRHPDYRLPQYRLHATWPWGRAAALQHPGRASGKMHVVPAQHEPIAHHYPIRKLGSRLGPTSYTSPCPIFARGARTAIFAEDGGGERDCEGEGEEVWCQGVSCSDIGFSPSGQQQSHSGKQKSDVARQTATCSVSLGSLICTAAQQQNHGAWGSE